MSKVDLNFSLKVTESDCDTVENCQNYTGLTGTDLKRETIELAPAGTSIIFINGPALDKIIYVESAFDFQININDLGFVDVKRNLVTTKFLKSIFFSKLSVTKIEIKNNSGTDTIKVSYNLA